MLGNLCSLWPDPVAAVVYVPTASGLSVSANTTFDGRGMDTAAATCSAFFKRMEAEGEIHKSQLQPGRSPHLNGMSVHARLQQLQQGFPSFIYGPKKTQKACCSHAPLDHSHLYLLLPSCAPLHVL